ncbi:MAG: uroporphyrinogen-III synthase [Thaumarchaeota archaeon]|nr:MAG: uroporphyrinogen-III synthase [Nitrososphaerota archaeon]
MIAGKTIAITRSKEDSEEFIQLIMNAKARTIPLPTIELVSKGEKIVDEFLNAIKEVDPDFSVFMSSKAVKLLFDTSRKVSKYDIAHMPNRFSSVGVGEVFTRLNAEGKKVIVPRSGASTPFLAQLLEKIGLEVKEIYLYDVCSFRDTSQWNEFRELFANKKVDGIIFTSASSVNAFFDIMLMDMGKETLLQNLRTTKVVAIGPFTADELKKSGAEPIIADVHTVPGAFETIKNCFC